MIEETFIMLKPDATKNKSYLEILERICSKGFEIQEMYLTHPSEKTIRKHYSEVIENRGEPLASQLVEYISSGPVLPAIVQGNNAVKSIRALAGESTEPINCSPGTIRGDYSNDSYELAEKENRCVMNVIHTSDSKKSAEKEIDLWFNRSAHKTAETIGVSIDDLVNEIIETSRKEKFVYHGIKKADLADIEKEGILPLTPETDGSCWASGSALFYPEFNSPFFNYSGGLKNEGKTELKLAIAQAKDLNIDFKQDSELVVNEKVPFSKISLIDVIVNHPKEKNFRECRQEAEKLLLSAVYLQVIGSHTKGQTVKLNKRLY